MFIALATIQQALTELKDVHPFFGFSYLAFKKVRLPVGEAVDINFSRMADEFLSAYFRPTHQYKGYYNPFGTSNPGKRWVKPRYASTSLQRITTDTFGNAFIHEKTSSRWGWRANYVETLLLSLRGHKLPALPMATWLYREQNIPDGEVQLWLTSRFCEEFRISPSERKSLFDWEPRIKTVVGEQVVSEEELLNVIGDPPDMPPAKGSIISSIELRGTGPSTELKYEPSRRLNIITGDNSLGKTFLLECIWWAMTNDWLGYPAQPRSNAVKDSSEIRWQMSSSAGRMVAAQGIYYPKLANWKRSSKASASPGVVLYCRFDGSFAIWDPLRLTLSPNGTSLPMFLTRDEVWNGKQKEAVAAAGWLCNGLVRDWVTWQLSGSRYGSQYRLLTKCLECLSPSTTELLRPGNLTRLPGDSRDTPTLVFPYGEVPIELASAGIQRILGLAYMMAWVWTEHLEMAKMSDLAPEGSLMLLIDEAEAHLHPKWQRILVPAILRSIEVLSHGLVPQIHLATHSPMILLGAETTFTSDDSLHVLNLDDSNVTLTRHDFNVRGRADLWLVSPIFGLGQPRSKEAEEAINEAKEILQRTDRPIERLRAINAKLERLLAPSDEFWPRWRYYVEQGGRSQ